ncbi:MAG: peroxiredoxin family protein [Sphingobacterium sp.]|uniref:peroxiredoxin family protein n=1 Tax=Sphingobacterium sp. JB170 TaxID=1434842 RepID=UPI00211B02A0|nr:redoxin domain-containing protein [Sphingobacterium sp. JB170]
MIKYFYSGLTLALITGLTACQSEATNNNAVQQVQQETPAAHPQAQASQPQTAPLIKDAATSLPAFKFYKVKSGIEFTNADIESGKNTAFVLFDPNCGHCQHEAGLLAKNYDKIKDINIYFVSMNEPALMASFLETFGKELVDKPNIEVLYDRNQEFIQKIHVPEQFPANYIYGADGSLKNHWEGEKEIGFILSELTK